MFKRVGVFSDIHWGKKSDSETHNRDCLDFIEWFCDNAADRKCDSIFVMGDWFDNRSRIRLDSQWFSYDGLDRLHRLGLPTYFIVGNHDMFFRMNRSIHSLRCVSYYDRFHLIDDTRQIDDVLFCPFLIPGEYPSVIDREVRYVFGHFEFPTFMVNENYAFEDHGGIHGDMFEHPEWVFSGHFHKRQIRTNPNGVKICYIGNPFPHDYNDVGDRERGCMFFDYGGEPEFVNYQNGPTFDRIDLSELVTLIESDSLTSRFGAKSVIECRNDLNIPHEETLELKDALQGMVRDVKFIGGVVVDETTETNISDEPLEDVSTMVLGHLNRLDTVGTTLDRDFLKHLYQNIRA